MRYFSWELHKKIIRYFIFILMGIFIGMFITLYLHGNQLDQLHLYSDRLEDELKDCKDTLTTLQEEQNKRKQNQLIRSIEFHIEEKLEPFNEVELLKALKEETRFLIGKKVEDVGKSPEFIYRLLNNKSFKVKDHSFLVKVKIIYIQTKIDVWLSTREEKIAN